MSIQLKKFTIASLLEMDSGKVGAAIQLAIKAAMTDIEDRPHDERPRKVGLTMFFEPTDVDRQGNVETCSARFKIKTSIPELESMSYSMKAGANKELLFSAESPEDVNQHIIPGTRTPKDGDQ